MRIISFDWATTKEITYYDATSGKVKVLANTLESFEKFLAKLKEPVTMLFEAGGGDTLKIMAFRAGHTVLTVPGIKVKEYRDRSDKIKSDEIDPKTLFEFYEEEGAVSAVHKLGRSCPPSFYPFTEHDASIASLKILFRSHEDMKKEMVREKLKLIAFRRRYELVNVDAAAIEKFSEHKKTSIEAKEKDLALMKKELAKKVPEFPIWRNYLQTIKGCGATIAAGMIAELGGRTFDNDESVKHYAGMIPRAASKTFNRYLKVTLFQFAECIIKARTPLWRPFYDDMKKYYLDRHPDWRPGKVDAYAKKLVETKFLLEFWKKWRTV